MSDNLPNTSFYYDMSTAKGMDTFLKHIHTIVKSNPELSMNSDIIYNELKFNNLKKLEVDKYSQGISVEHFFENWRQRFIGRKNLKAFRDEVRFPYFFQFVNPIKHDTGEYIKLYIPLDYEHLYEGVNQIFDFLDKEGIEHESIVSSQMRVDNVIIRLRADDFDNANKIIDFITSNSKIKGGLNRVNPFVPSRKGIGIMCEHGNSYNRDISKLICSYMDYCKINNINETSAEEFRKYIKSSCYDMSVLDTFELAYNGHSRVNTNEGILNGPLSEEQKYSLFLDTLRETYKKYGIKQIKSAIVNAINDGDYGFFIRGTGNTKYRENLRKFVSGEDIFNMINDRLKLFMDPNAISISIDGVASQFCDILFSDELVFMLDEISNVTLESRGKEQLEFALNQFLYTGKTSAFSRYRNGDTSINYRNKMARIDNKTILDIVSKSLRIKGIDTSTLDTKDLINIYINKLIESKYDYESGMSR